MFAIVLIEDMATMLINYQLLWYLLQPQSMQAGKIARIMIEARSFMEFNRIEKSRVGENKLIWSRLKQWEDRFRIRALVFSVPGYRQPQCWHKHLLDATNMTQALYLMRNQLVPLLNIHHDKWYCQLKFGRVYVKNTSCRALNIIFQDFIM